jgi:hypothetical protein
LAAATPQCTGHSGIGDVIENVDVIAVVVIASLIVTCAAPRQGQWQAAATPIVDACVACRRVARQLSEVRSATTLALSVPFFIGVAAACQRLLSHCLCRSLYLITT